MARRFSKCPTWWVRDGQLGIQKFGGGKNAGANIAALKCILGISTSIDFWTRKAKLSISDLEALTGLSRPMVIRGLKGLVELGIVKVDKTAHVHEYELTTSSNDDGWGKIPYERVRKQLPEIPNRGWHGIRNNASKEARQYGLSGGLYAALLPRTGDA